MVFSHLDEGNAFANLRGSAIRGNPFGADCARRDTEGLDQGGHRLVPIGDREAWTGGRWVSRLRKKHDNLGCRALGMMVSQ